MKKATAKSAKPKAVLPQYPQTWQLPQVNQKLQKRIDLLTSMLKEPNL